MLAEANLLALTKFMFPVEKSLRVGIIGKMFTASDAHIWSTVQGPSPSALQCEAALLPW